METIAVVLNVRTEHVEAFEAGFRQHELPVWRDLRERGLLERATLNRLDISSRPVEGTQQYLISVIFTSDEGHHATTSIRGSRPGMRSPTPTSPGTPSPSAGRRSSSSAAPRRSAAPGRPAPASSPGCDDLLRCTRPIRSPAPGRRRHNRTWRNE